MKPEKLKPCPFCGGEGEFVTYEHVNRTVVFCKKCNVGTCLGYRKSDAARVWSRRVPAVLSDEAWERIRKALRKIADKAYAYSANGTHCIDIEDIKRLVTAEMGRANK